MNKMNKMGKNQDFEDKSENKTSLEVRLLSYNKAFIRFEKFKYTSDPDTFQSMISDGHEIISFLELLTKFFENKLFRVYMYYEILDRQYVAEENSEKFLKYKSTDIFRTLYVSGISESILTRTRKVIFEKGEIYSPVDPLSLAFRSLKVTVGDLYLRTPQHIENRLTQLVPGRASTYNLIPVKSIYLALRYIKTGDLNCSEYVHMRLPMKLRKLGFNTHVDLQKLDFTKQIELLNGCKKTKGSAFNKKFVLVTEQEIPSFEYDSSGETVYFTYLDGLYLIRPTRICNLDLTQRPIRYRELSYVVNDITIFVDTEFNWCGGHEQDIEVGEVKYPQYLTYAIVRGEEVDSDGEFVVPPHTGIFQGKDSVLQFLTMLNNQYGYGRSGSRNKVTCIAHNASGIENIFFLTCISEQLTAHYENYEMKFNHVTGTKVHSFPWHHITFIDSMLYMAGSLKNITKALCKKYIKQEISKEELLSADWSNPTEEQQKYAMYDTLALAEAWYKYTILINGVISKKSTVLLSLTMFKSGSALMKWVLTKDVAIRDTRNTTQEERDELFREALLGWDNEGLSSLREMIYMGGRCECEYLGTNESFKSEEVLADHQKIFGLTYNKDTDYEVTATSIDMVSSYPNSMSRGPVPGRVVGKGEYTSKQELDRIISIAKAQNKYVLMVGKLRYKTHMRLPLLCVQHNKKLVFPNLMSGTITATFFDFEYEAIKDNICDEGFSGDYIITKHFTGFAPKIKEMFDLRKKAKKDKNEGLGYVVKVLLNSGYGGLGLNPIRETSYLSKGASLDRRMNLIYNATTYEGPGGFTWVVTKQSKEVNSLVITAAFITATSRFLLWKEMMFINSRGDFVLYTDTDGIKFIAKTSDKKFYDDRYTNNEELGDFKIEGRFTSWEIAGLKVYRMGDTIMYKGVRGDINTLLDDSGKLKRTVDVLIWGRGRDGVLTTHRTTKKMRFTYDKGYIFSGSKGVITPLNL